MEQLYQSEAFPALVASVCGAVGAFVLLASGALSGPLPKMLQEDEEDADEDPAKAFEDLKKALLGNAAGEGAAPTSADSGTLPAAAADNPPPAAAAEAKADEDASKEAAASCSDEKKAGKDDPVKSSSSDALAKGEEEDKDEMQQMLERVLPSSKRLTPEQEAQIRKQVHRMPEEQRRAIQAWLNDDGDHFWVHVGMFLLIAILFVGAFIIFSAYLIVAHEFNIYDPESWRNATISLEHTLRRNRILSPKGGWLLPEGIVIQERQLEMMQYDEL
mmetsp:Transcript_83476/g.174680  ORF Transcript_83476/g.174680 Transcript_83476/m.174680 type:complete len:274 (-) Transcript_83476:23-844(-)